MAKTTFNPLGQWQGRIGSMVYKIVDGQQVIAPYQPNVYNPNTTKQIKARAKFKSLANLNRAVATEMLLPYGSRPSHARRLFLKEQAALIKANCVWNEKGDAVEKDYAAMKFSPIASQRVAPSFQYAKSDNPYEIEAHVREYGTAYLKWLMLIVYEPESGKFAYSYHFVNHTHEEKVEDISMKVPVAWAGAKAHVYGLGAYLANPENTATPYSTLHPESTVVYGDSPYGATFELLTSTTDELEWTTTEYVGEVSIS